MHAAVSVMDENQISGLVESLTFRNDENGYFVARVKVPGKKDDQYVVGNAASISPGEHLFARGRWERSRYGEQFKATEIKLTTPTDASGAKKYLASAVKGVGKGFAQKLVDAFGSEVFRIIEQEPSRLASVPGIGPKRAASIIEVYNLKREEREIMVFLHGHGLSPSRAGKAYIAFREKTIDIVRANPYALTSLRGIGFLTADVVAKRLGIKPDHPFRIRAAILHLLREETDSGSCGLPVVEALKKGQQLLGEADVSINKIEEVIESCVGDETVIRDHASTELCLFLPGVYHSEKQIAANILKRLKQPLKYPIEDIEQAILTAELELGLQLEEGQRKAVRLALSEPVVVITGGPGTGKTTITRIILMCLKEAGMQVLVCAPTGKAAKRASEAIGEQAKTIHRMLGVSKIGEFVHNEDNPLDCEALIADELSMVDVALLNSMLKAAAPGTRLVLVGDVDQLPSVGPGKVLADIIGSGVVPTARLTEVFRQAATSKIILNAHRVNGGHSPEQGWAMNSDFGFLVEKDAELAEEMLLRQARNMWKLGFDPLKDVQVLSPMRKGTMGTERLNRKLREMLNPDPVAKVPFRDDFLGTGDKVIQTRNNYTKQVFNGEIGFVVDIQTSNREVTVDYDGRLLTYSSSELDELRLAYALTIHRSQGSEFPAVLMGLCYNHFMMLKRNLLYTGITRAKRLMLIFGNPAAAAQAARNSQVEERHSKLRDWLRKGAFESTVQQDLLADHWQGLVDV